MMPIPGAGAPRPWPRWPAPAMAPMTPPWTGRTIPAVCPRPPPARSLPGGRRHRHPAAAGPRSRTPARPGLTGGRPASHGSGGRTLPCLGTPSAKPPQAPPAPSEEPRPSSRPRRPGGRRKPPAVNQARTHGQAASGGAAALAVTFTGQARPRASQKMVIQAGRRSGLGRGCGPGPVMVVRRRRRAGPAPRPRCAPGWWVLAAGDAPGSGSGCAGRLFA